MMSFGLFMGCRRAQPGCDNPQAQLLSCSEEDPFLLLESPTPPSGHGLPLWIDRARDIAVKMKLGRCFGQLTFLL